MRTGQQVSDNFCGLRNDTGHRCAIWKMTQSWLGVLSGKRHTAGRLCCLGDDRQLACSKRSVHNNSRDGGRLGSETPGRTLYLFCRRHSRAAPPPPFSSANCTIITTFIFVPSYFFFPLPFSCFLPVLSTLQCSPPFR